MKQYTQIKNDEQIYKFKFKNKDMFWLEHKDYNETLVIFSAFYNTFKKDSNLSNFTVNGINVDDYFQITIEDSFRGKSLTIKFSDLFEYLTYSNAVNRNNKIDSILNN